MGVKSDSGGFGFERQRRGVMRIEIWTMKTESWRRRRLGLVGVTQLSEFDFCKGLCSRVTRG